MFTKNKFLVIVKTTIHRHLCTLSDLLIRFRYLEQDISHVCPCMYYGLQDWDYVHFQMKPYITGAKKLIKMAIKFPIVFHLVLPKSMRLTNNSKEWSFFQKKFLTFKHMYVLSQVRVHVCA
jgi:hypothetical protein